MTQPGNLINQKLSIGRLFIGAKLTAHKGTGQVLHREYQKSLMALHLTCLTPSRDFKTELHLVIQDASLPVFLLICNLSRHPRNPIPTLSHFQPFSSPSHFCLMILLETLTYKGLHTHSDIQPQSISLPCQEITSPCCAGK